MFDLCVIGHVTKDIIRTKKIETVLPGGVPYYCLAALKNLELNNCVITKVAKEDRYLLGNFKQSNIKVFCLESRETTIFENIYPEDNTDIRIQNVPSIAQPFQIEDIPNISAKIYHLGSLTKEDIPLEVLKYLSTKGKISLDIQGFLRKVENGKVKKIDWKDKSKGLTYINILKADEAEAKILSGEKDIKQAAIRLSTYGIDEIIITSGSKGSLIYSQETFYSIAPFLPRKIVDATGCGDTYMAGYLYKRLQNADISESGKFAAAMASLKLEYSGSFQGNENDVQNFLNEVISLPVN